MDPSAALLFGILAGLALALPLGAIGVLLVQEGVTRGWRRGLPSAAGVATVDTCYCALALTAGYSAAPVLERLTPWPGLLGGVVLVVLGCVGLNRVRRPAAPGGGRISGAPGSPRARFALFLGLTAVNPATLLYFMALLPGLTRSGPAPGAHLSFVVGVGAASLLWQILLVGAGALLRRTLSTRVRAWTAAAGSITVSILGFALMAAALTDVP